MLVFFLYGCNTWEKDFDKLVKEQGIDMRNYLYLDTIVFTKTPSVRFSMGIASSIARKQDSLIAMLPAANLQLAKLYYYHMLVDSLAKASLSSQTEIHAHRLSNYQYYAAISASASAVGSLAIIKSNQPLNISIGGSKSLSFSYGKSPMVGSVVALIIASPSSIELFSNNDITEMLPDSILRQSIEESFNYYKSFFQITDDLTELKNHSIRAATILNQHHLITIHDFINEFYFVNYLSLKGYISNLEKGRYLNFMSNFKKPLTGVFKFEGWQLLDYLKSTLIAIDSSNEVLRKKLNMLQAAQLSDRTYEKKLKSLIAETSLKGYKAVLKECNCHF